MEEKKQILVIDDDTNIGPLLSALLEEMGLEVDIARDGEKGFQMLFSGKAYALAFIDIMMPFWDGEQLVQALDLIGEPTKVIVITGYPNSKQAQEIVCHPSVLELIEKPFDLEAIRCAVGKIA